VFAACAILHRTGAKAFVPAQRLEVVHCANRRRRTRGWLTGRALASIGLCVANSVQNATHSPVVRERIIVARPAYVPLPVLPLPRYGYAEERVVVYGLVSETENTCRGKDGRLHLAAFFSSRLYFGAGVKHPQKITLGKRREMGIRGLLVYWLDYKAAKMSKSAPTNGRITSGFPISSPLFLCVAGARAPKSERILIESASKTEVAERERGT
jgi:hypothetical protein